MNFNTFGNLVFRRFLRISFHSFHLDVEGTSGEKNFFVYVGITQFVLIFTKTSNIHFLRRRRYKLVASRQLKIPFGRRIGSQRGRAFAALAQVIEGIAIPVLRKNIVPATKCVGAEFWNLLRQILQWLLVIQTNLRQQERVWEHKLLQNCWVVVAGRNCKQGKSNKICKSTQSVVKRHFYIKFLLIMPNNLRYQAFVAVSRNLRGKVQIVDDVLLSQEQEIYPTTSLDENCIEFDFQTDRFSYADLRQTYFVLKLTYQRFQTGAQ